MFLSVFSILPLILISSLIVIDPLNILHRQCFTSKMYYGDFRFGALGVIKYANFDSIILGSSMMENTSSNVASNKLGGNFVNISFGASTAFEKASILRYALKLKKIKKVIMTIEAYYLRFKENIYLPKMNYFSLYDSDSALKKFSTYGHNMPILFKWIFYRSTAFHSNLDCPCSWANNKDYIKTFGGFQNWVARYYETYNVWILYIFREIQDVYLGKKIKFPELTGKEKKCIQERMYEDIVSIAINNPNTQFEIVIPPYSKLFWKVDMNYLFRDLEYAVRYLIGWSSKLNNLHIHGFDNEEFTKDIKNYKDKDHYHPKVNTIMINAIAAKTHILTSLNIDTYFENFKEDIASFDLKPLYEQIKDL